MVLAFFPHSEGRLKVAAFDTIHGNRLRLDLPFDASVGTDKARAFFAVRALE